MTEIIFGAWLSAVTLFCLSSFPDPTGEQLFFGDTMLICMSAWMLWCIWRAIKRNLKALAIHIVVASAILLFTLGAVCIQKSFAQDHPGHPRFHESYNKWAQPGTKSMINPQGTSCCNARQKVEWGMGRKGPPTYVSGDCYPTAAFYAAGRWWAKADDYDRWYTKEDWLEIPDAKLIREVNPDDSGGMAHVCTSQGKVLCFVPPTGVQ